MEKLRYGIVGAGRIAQAYALAFAQSETARLVAVADVREEAARTLAEGFDGCASFSSYEELTDARLLDAVVVCTPPATHEEVALRFVARGVHVLCEKPLSISSASARAMLDAADAAGVRLTMASKFRYVEDVVRSRSIVESGEIGELVLFENVFASYVDMRGRWNSRPEVSGGGVLIDNGTHSVDLARYFLGPIADVQAAEGRRCQGLAVEETARLLFTSAGGVLGSVDLSWSFDKETDSYVRLYGTRGEVRLGWRESAYRRAGASDWVTFGAGYDKVRAFRGQLDNFSRAVRGEEALRVTAADALASVEVVEAAYEALRLSRRTGVGDFMQLVGCLPGATMTPELVGIR